MTKTFFHRVAIAAAFTAMVCVAVTVVPAESSPAYAVAGSPLIAGVHASGSAGIGS